MFKFKCFLSALILFNFSPHSFCTESPDKDQNNIKEKTFTEKALENTTKAYEFVKEKSIEAKKSIDEKALKSVNARDSRSFGIYGNYSYLDLLIPGKTGFNAYKSFDDKNTQYEFQYVKGDYSVPLVITPLGEINDKRYTLLKRTFSDNGNLNWYYGFSYISFDGHIGSDLLNKLTVNGSSVPNVNLFEITSLGIDFGIGHRWHFNNNFSFGVDWFSFSQPILILKKYAPYADAESTSDTDKNNAKNTINTIAYFPRLVFIKLNLGISF